MGAADRRPRFALNSAQIKAIAAGLMVIDHIGVVFFPQTLLFRYVGRLSFPLFCWLLAQGERRTRYIVRYGVRLFVFGVISQPIYGALFNTAQLNVLFTLLVGLVTLRLGRMLPQTTSLIWATGILVATLIPMDGSGYGVAIMLLMGQPMTLLWWGAWLMLHGLLAISGQFYVAMSSWVMQIWAAPAPLIAALASGDRGPKIRWFYWFYPGHLLALWLIRRMV
ncbi:MAG: TraX family protein [Elainellaceae cyanobacterium]